MLDIERKFNSSQTNKSYKFRKKSIKEREHIDENSVYSDDFIDNDRYDLHY